MLFAFSKSTDTTVKGNMRKAIDKDIVEFDVHMIVVEVAKKHESNRIPSDLLFHAHSHTV